MSYMIEKQVVNYIRQLEKTSEGDLNKIEEYAKQHHVPIVEPETARLIKVLIKLNKPMKILEIGTAIGYSSILMKKAAGEKARITTIEIREEFYLLAKENICQAGFQDEIQVILGDANEVLNHLQQSFDMIFLDAAKGQYLNYLEKLCTLLAPGGFILSDNVLYKGMVTDDSLVKRRKITIVKRLRKFLNSITTMEGYLTAIIPIGDGLAITYKEDSEFE